MSGVHVIGALLRANPAVLALVPLANIKAGPLSIGFDLPAIGVMSISANEDGRLAKQPTRRVNERVQVTVVADNYDDKEAVMKAVRNACAEQVGDFAGVTSVSVLTWGKGPDFKNEDATLFQQTQDFRVSFVEATA